MGPAQLPIKWVPGVKRSGRETDHTSQFSAEIHNGEAIPPLPTRLNGVVLMN
jgi:hypothetical protein